MGERTNGSRRHPCATRLVIPAAFALLAGALVAGAATATPSKVGSAGDDAFYVDNKASCADPLSLLQAARV